MPADMPADVTTGFFLLVAFSLKTPLQAGELQSLAVAWLFHIIKNASRFEQRTAMTEYRKGSQTVFHHRGDR